MQTANIVRTANIFKLMLQFSFVMYITSVMDPHANVRSKMLGKC